MKIIPKRMKLFVSLTSTGTVLIIIQCNKTFLYTVMLKMAESSVTAEVDCFWERGTTALDRKTLPACSPLAFAKASTVKHGVSGVLEWNVKGGGDALTDTLRFQTHAELQSSSSPLRKTGCSLFFPLLISPEVKLVHDGGRACVSTESQFPPHSKEMIA